MVFLRADGNPEIGAGHVMRCLSIAGGVPPGEGALFLTAGDDFTGTIRAAGVQSHILNTDYRDMGSEVGQMRELIEKHRPSALFVDSYYVTAPYLNALWEVCRSVGCKLAYMDDVLAFPYPCDFLINYNIYGPDRRPDYQRMYRDAGVCEPVLLLGTDYAPLRKGFQCIPARGVREKVSDILVSTGGSDPEHMALQLVREVMHRNLPYTFHFIIGPMNGDGDEITALASKNPNGHIVLHRNVTDMSGLMQKMDIAISAAGSTLYELCATQTPSLTYVLADNQMPGAEGFAKRGILSCVGDYRSDPLLPGKLVDAAVALADNYDTRKRMATKMRQLVDGKGVGRILRVVG